MNLEVDPEPQAIPWLLPKQRTQPHCAGLLTYRTVTYVWALFWAAKVVVICYLVIENCAGSIYWMSYETKMATVK